MVMHPTCNADAASPVFPTGDIRHREAQRGAESPAFPTGDIRTTVLATEVVVQSTDAAARTAQAAQVVDAGWKSGAHAKQLSVQVCVRAPCVCARARVCVWIASLCVQYEREMTQNQLCVPPRTSNSTLASIRCSQQQRAGHSRPRAAARRAQGILTFGAKACCRGQSSAPS